MDNRNFQSGASASAPVAPAAPSNGFPSNGNPATGTPATQPGAHWFHKIGEELRAVVTGAGITPTDDDLLQVSKAIQSGGLWSGVSGGTADVITATFTPGIVALTNGMSLNVRASFINATTAPTFTPNSGTIAAKGIVKGNGLSLVAGDIAGAGHWLILQYDSALAKWVLLNPATGIFSLGFGQTWQDMTAIRSIPTVFLNSTGRPIAMSITITPTLAIGYYSIVTGSPAVGYNTAVAANFSMGQASSIYAIIPAGHNYYVGKGGSDTTTNMHWYELRG